MRLYIRSYSSDCTYFKCQYDITLVIERSSVKALRIFSFEVLEILQYLFTRLLWAIDLLLQSRHLTLCLNNLITTGVLALAVM